MRHEALGFPLEEPGPERLYPPNIGFSKDAWKLIVDISESLNIPLHETAKQVLTQHGIENVEIRAPISTSELDPFDQQDTAELTPTESLFESN